MTRPYTLKKRAEKQAETRQRIVEATVALHTSLGPARTTIAAIAEEAGVQRHTVYAHFPDEAALYGACIAHWNTLYPFPDLRAAGDLAAVLRALYRWYETVGDHLELFIRDASVDPLAAAEMGRVAGQLGALADRLAPGRSRAARAAVGHALAFETWRSLVRREGLSNARAVRAMVSFAEAV